MSAKIPNIAKNTSYFTLALILQKIISFSYFTVYARELGPDDLGKFYFAISFTSIFAVFVDLGLNAVLIREVAKYRDKASSLISTILAIKLPLVGIFWLALVVIAMLSGYSEVIKKLIIISSLAVVMDSLTVMFYGISRGFHNLKYESIGSVLTQLSVLIFSLIVLALDWPLPWLMVSYVIGSFVNLSIAFGVDLLKWKIRFKLMWDKELIKPIVIMAIPFALAGIFQRFYSYIDSVLLYNLSGETAVGIYQIPYKITMALQFLPSAFVASLYPAMSQYWQSNRAQLRITFERSVKYLLIIASPIAAGIAVLAPKIVDIFKHQGFEGAITPLRIAMIGLFFLFMTFPVGSLLNACDLQKKNTINMGLTALISLIVNLALIPPLGATGASIALAVSAAAYFILGWRYVKYVINCNHNLLLTATIKTIALAALMSLVVWLLRDYFIAIPVMVGALFYAAGLFAVKLIGLADITSVYKSFKIKNK